MDWLQQIDLYCERVGPGFWGEPVNALSNIGFLLASFWAAIQLRKPMDWGLIALIVLSALIGVGSFLFHSYATLWASFADVIPIWVFVSLYVAIAIRRLSGKPPQFWTPTVSVIVALLVAAVWIIVSGTATDTGTASDPLNGSGQYAPALVALLVFAALLLYRRHPLRFWVLGAALAFVVSLGMRTIDLAVCADWPMGTHFLWHLLNSLMVALLLQALIRAEKM